MMSALQWRNDTDLANNAIVMLASLTIGLLSARLIAKPEQIGWLLVTLVAIQAAYSLGYQHLHIHSVLLGSIEKQRGTFMGATAMSTIMALVLPFAVGNIARENDTSLLFPSILLTAAIVTALWISRSPAAIFASGTGLTYLFWRYSRRAPLAAFIGIATLLTTSYMWRACSFSQRAAISTQQASVETPPDWEHGIGFFERNWVGGWGVGALRETVRDRLVVSDMEGKVISQEPGNLLLQWLDEMGVGGAVLFLLFIATISSCLWQRRTPWSYCLGASWLAFFILGMCRTPCGTISTLYGNVIVGLLLGATLLTQPQQPRAVSAIEPQSDNSDAAFISGQSK